MDLITLPEELLVNILSFLNPTDLLEASKVNQKFYKLITSYKILSEKFVLNLTFTNANLNDDVVDTIVQSDRKFYQLKISNLNYETENSTKFIIAMLEKYGKLIENFHFNEIVIDAKLFIAILIMIPNVRKIFINSCTVVNKSNTRWLISASLKFRKLKIIDTKRFQTSTDYESTFSVFDFFKEARDLEKLKVSNCQWSGFPEFLGQQTSLKTLNIYASPGEEIFNQKVASSNDVRFKLLELSIQADLPDESQLKNFKEFIEKQDQLKDIRVVIASSPESGMTRTFDEILTLIFGNKYLQSIQLIMFPHNLPTKVLTSKNPILKSLSIRFIWMETDFLAKMISCYPNLMTLNLQYYGDIDTNQVILLNSLEHLENLSIKRIFGFDLANLKIRNLSKFRCGPVFMLSSENVRDFCQNNPELKELKIDSLRKSYNINNEKLKIIVNNLKKLEVLSLEADRIEKLNSESVKMILSKCENIRQVEIRLPNHTRYLNEFNSDISRMAEISRFSYSIFKGCTDFIFKLQRI